MDFRNNWEAVGKISMMALLIAVVLLRVTVAIAGINENLVEAAKRGDLPEVKRLLAEGAEANAKDQYGKTALARASMKGHWEVQDMLLKAGAK
jgi:hypothetical protein